MKIELSSTFRKAFKKLASKGPDIAILTLEKVLLFSQEPYNITLRFHKLKGSLSGTWSFSVDLDVRIIVDMKEPDKAILVMIGSHDEVY
jgi:mRNA-degrading endonuclease YafQ of YafQ-DinJ toxin-antitoxin module